MLQKNVLAMFIHFIIGAVSFIFSAITFKGGTVIVDSIVGIYAGIAVFAYIWVGKRFFNNYDSKLKNLISVSSVAVLGLIITILIVPITSVNPLVLYFGYALPIISVLPSTTTLHLDPVVSELVGFIILSLAPSISMWIGIELRRAK